MARSDELEEQGKRRDDRDEDDRRAERKKRHKSSSRKRDHDDRHHASSQKHSAREDEGRRHKSRRERDDDSSSDASSRSSDPRDRKRRKKEKKHRREEKKKKRKKHRKEERKSRRNDVQDPDEATSQLLERNHAFASALYNLLQSHPGMATELPILLIRLAGGTTFNLSQMSDDSASRGLQQVLATLSPFGVEKGSDGQWGWKPPGGVTSHRNTENELLLVKVARSLLDQIGVTADAVANYGRETRTTEHDSIPKDDAELDDVTLLLSETRKLLESFEKDKEAGSETPTLAQELGELCSLILSGESIALDGLPDELLRHGIEQIFARAGLEKSEMEDDSEEEDDECKGEPALGYGLPESDEGTARAKMLAVLDICRDRAASSSDGGQRPSRRPAVVMPSNHPSIPVDEDDDDDDDDEEVGPAPVGSKPASRRVQRGPTLPPEVVKAMADRRKRELDGITTGFEPPLPSGEITEREQWMMEPGQHEFLQGIKSGAPLKSRNFQNKKQSSSMEPVAPIDPSVQAEMDAIMKMHRDARGPSLVEQHRIKKAEEKAAAKKDGKAEWKWTRDGDLDAGRRVDKNALGMVMGGASSDLKEKFQGGYSRGFM